MATAPQLEYEGTVGRALPSVQQNSVASPEMMGGAAAQRDARFGAGMMQAGKELAAVAIDMAEKENTAKVQAARTELGNRTLDYLAKAKQAEVGANAAGATARFRDWHNKQVEELTKGLANSEAQRAFGIIAAQHGLSSRGEVATFELGETKRYQKETNVAAINNKIDEGANAVTEFAVREARKEALRNAEIAIRQEGMDAAQAKQYQRGVLTEFHGRRIHVLAVQNPQAAMEYYKANFDEIDAKARPQLEELAKKAGAQKLGIDTATGVMDEMGPKTPRDTFEYEKMEKALRDRLKDSPEAFTVASAQLAHRYNVFNADRKATDDKLGSAVARMANQKMAPAQIARTPEFQALSDLQQRTWLEFWKKDALHNEQINAARESREYTRVMREEAQRTKDFRVATWEYSNPATLSGMSEQEILALTPKIGTQNVDFLMQSKRALSASEDKVREAKMDHEDFLRIAINSGMHPKDKTPNEDQKNELVLIQADVENRIARAQAALPAGKMLSRAQKQAIAQEAFDDKVLTGGFLGIWQKAKPVGSLTDEQMVKTVPADVLETIKRELAKKQLPATDSNIASQWRSMSGLREERRAAEQALKDRVLNAPATNPTAPRGLKLEQ